MKKSEHSTARHLGHLGRKTRSLIFLGLTLMTPGLSAAAPDQAYEPSANDSQAGGEELEALKRLSLSKRPGLAILGLNCGELKNGVGPYDYREAKALLRKYGQKGEYTHKPLHYLLNVEGHHWSTNVDQLKKGVAASVPTDLNYILRAFPNHVPALWAKARYNLRNPIPELNSDHAWPWTTRCYIDRAIRFAPDDGIPWMIWGVVNHRKKKYAVALDAYLMASKLGIRSSELEYNIGLAYVALKKPAEAVPYAKRAYEMGYPLPGLKRKLQKMGLW